MKRLAHKVADDDIDLDLAVAMGLQVAASCGHRWVPAFVGDEVDQFPKCSACYSTKRRHVSQNDRPVPHYVYRFFDEQAALVYVGCTVNPVGRIDNHRSSSWWFPHVTRQRLTVYPTRDHALRVERQAIATESPRFNIKGRWSGRSLWTAAEYTDYHAALLAVGTNTPTRLEHMQKVIREARQRYGLELQEEAA